MKSLFNSFNNKDVRMENSQSTRRTFNIFGGFDQISRQCRIGSQFTGVSAYCSTNQKRRTDAKIMENNSVRNMRSTSRIIPNEIYTKFIHAQSGSNTNTHITQTNNTQYTHIQGRNVFRTRGGRLSKNKENMGRCLNFQMENDKATEPKFAVQDLQPSLDETQGTKIETAQPVTKIEVTKPKGDSVTKLASTAPEFKLQDLFDRWIPIDEISIETGGEFGKLLWIYYLPRDLYKKVPCSPVLTPLRNFVYGTFDITIRFMLNSTKFHSGRLLIALKFDPYAADNTHLGLNAALMRPHVILDCSVSNSVEMNIPYRFRRAYTHINDGLTGTNSAQYMNIHIYLLSPLQTGKGGLQSVKLRPLFKMTSADLTGINASVPQVQMYSLTERIKNAEKSLVYGLKAVTGDKPTDLSATIIVPRPRLNFMGSKGLCDAIPMRSDITGLTMHYAENIFEDDPKTIQDVIKMEGVRARFEWTVDMKVDDILLDMVPDPTWRYEDTSDTTPTPLEYMTSMFNFWTGEIDIRLDFVSTTFHTGSVIVSAEFDRQDDTMCGSSSTYTKICDIQEQTSFEFNVPFVYSTYANRNTLGPHSGPIDFPSVADWIAYQAFNIKHRLRTKLRVRVVNALVAPDSVSRNIYVLVYWKAGKNFKVEQLCSTGWRKWDNKQFLNLPYDTKPTTYRLPKQDLRTLNEKRVIKHQFTDTTEITSLVDILRRPLLIIINRNVDKDVFAIPMMAPSMVHCPENKTKNSIYQPYIMASPQVSVNNLFRFWRGSMRYTFFFYGLGDNLAPIYITYLPRSGTRQQGAFDWMALGGAQSGAHIGSGLLTEIVIPSINPSITIEVPYASENTWTLMFEDDGSMEYTWRDKADTTNGTLLISCTSKFTMDVWWSAGDDFKIANCFGPPKCYNNSAQYSFSDIYGKMMLTANTITYVKDKYNIDLEKKTLYELIQESNKATGNQGKILKQMVKSVKAEKVSDLSLQKLTKDAVNQAINKEYFIFKANPENKKPTTQMIDTPKTQMMFDIFGSICDLEFESLAKGIAESIINNSTQISVGVAAASTAVVANKFVTTAKKIDSVTEKVDKFIETSQEKFSNIGTNIFSNFMFDIINCLINKNWTTVCLTLGKVIANFGYSDILCKIEGKITMLVDTIKELLLPTTQANTHDPIMVLTGCIVSILGTIMGICLKKQEQTLMDILRKTLSEFLNLRTSGYVLNVIRLVTILTDSLKSFFWKLFGYEDPRCVALEFLKRDESQFKKFVEDAMKFIDENNNTMLSSPSYRARFWCTVIEAKKILSAIAVIPDKVVSPVLVKLCRDVIDKGMEKSVDMRSCPVRYEPFTFMIESAPGLGKSTMVDGLISDLFVATQHTFTGQEIVYTKNSGGKFWSNFNGQPAVKFDEFFQLNDPNLISSQLEDLFMLKTSAMFTPPMAELKEKNIKANPMIVAFLTNDAFPDAILKPYKSDPTAIYRRRDVLIKCELKEEYAHVKNIREEIPLDVLNKVEHLQFKLYKDVKDRNSLDNKVLTYLEVKEVLISNWKKWHEIEEQNVTKRLKRMYEQLGTMDSVEMIKTDPFRIFYGLDVRASTEVQNGFLPSDILEFEIEKFMRFMQHLQSTNTIREQMDIIGFGTTVCTSFIGTDVLASMGMDIFDLFSFDKKCVICEGPAAKYIKCENTVDTHYTCSTCFFANRSERCGGCNLRVTTNFSPNARSFWTYFVSSMKAGIYKFMFEIKSFMNNSKTIVYPMMVFEIFNFILLYTFEQTTPIQKAYVGQMILAYLLNKSYHFKKDMIAVAPVFQADEPELNLEGELNSLKEISVLKVMESYMSRSEDTQCDHKFFTQELINNLNVQSQRPSGPNIHISYQREMPRSNKKGTWTIGIEGQVYKCKDSYCNKECFLRVNFGSWYTFVLHQYLKTHGISMVRQMSDTDQSDEFRFSYVPPYYEFTRYDIQNEIINEVQIIQQQSWIDMIKERLPKIAKIIAAVLGVFAIFKGIQKYLHSFNFTQSNIPYSVTAPSTPREIRYTRIPTRVQEGRTSRIMDQLQSPTILDIIKDKVERNYVLIETNHEGNKKRMCGLGIVSHYLIMPRHYFQYLLKFNPIIKLYHTYKKDTYNYEFSPVDFIISETSDLAIMRVPRGMDMFKDIRSYFIKDERLKKTIPSEGFLNLVPTGTRKNVIIQNVEIQKLIQRLTVNSSVDGIDIDVVDAIQYNYSESGACGSILHISEQQPLIGMHIAGTGTLTQGEGYASLITQEMLNELLPKDKNIFPRLQLEELGPLEEAVFQPPEEMDVELIGSVNIQLAPYVPGKTKIVPSLIQSELGIESYTQPGYLSKNTEGYKHQISPLIAGVIQHGFPTQDFRSDIVEKAKSALYERFFRYVNANVVEARRLTISEAVVGLPGIEYYECIDMTTSVGWPWTTVGKTQKKDFIEVLVDEQLRPISVARMDEAIVERLNENLIKRRKGEVPPVVFVDTLKDERRKPLKRDKLGGTRVFCASPIDYTIEMRQNFLHFMAMFRSKRIETPHGIGISPDGPEWTKLALRLTNMNRKGIFTIDYSNFGASINKKILEAVVDIIVNWTLEHVQDVDEVEMRSILENIISSDHIVKNLIYRQKCGAPSGSAMTDIINSLANMLYLMCAWTYLTGKSYEIFFNHVVMFTYGDDGLLSVSKDYIELFNAKTISEFFSNYGIISTDASKSEEIKPYHDIYEATFLKRGFAKHPYNNLYYLAPMEEYVLKDVPLWIWKTADRKRSTRENAEQALNLTYGKGKNYYEKYRQQINYWLSRLRIEPILTTWDDLNNIFFPEY